MNVVVTGALGAAGSYLSEYLNAQGDHVFPINRPSCNLLDIDAVCRILEIAKPDVIYHLAADADVRESFDIPYTVMHNNIMGTVNLFDACIRLNIRPVIQICSTSEVYGNPGTYPITEDYPIAPVNPYAVSKTCQDLYGGMCAKSYLFRVVRTRAFGYINPRRANLSLSSFARQIVSVERGMQPAVRHGNLDSIRTFCDVRDICKAYRLAAQQEGVFNIGSEQPISIGDALDILVGYARCPIKLRCDPALFRPVDVTNQIPDCSKFRKATGWQPERSLEESLKWLLTTTRLQN